MAAMGREVTVDRELIPPAEAVNTVEATVVEAATFLLFLPVAELVEAAAVTLLPCPRVAVAAEVAVDTIRPCLQAEVDMAEAAVVEAEAATLLPVEEAMFLPLPQAADTVVAVELAVEAVTNHPAVEVVPPQLQTETPNSLPVAAKAAPCKKARLSVTQSPTIPTKTPHPWTC